MELVAVGPDRRQVRRQDAHHLDVGGAQAVGDDLERLADRVVELDRRALAGLAARHRQEGAHDARAPVGGGADLERALADRAVRGEILEQAGVADHHRERVVELVGDAGEQRAERAHLLVLVQDLALPGEFGLDPLALGQVDQRGDHGVLALEGDQPRGERCPEFGPVGAAQADLDPVQAALAPQPLHDFGAVVGIGVEAQRRAGEQLVKRHAKKLGAGRAGENDLGRVEMGDEQRHRMGFGERAEALLAGLQRLLHRLARGDVDIEAADVGDAAVRTAHRKADHQVPGIAVQVRQAFLAHQHPAGAQHLLIAFGDEGRIVTDRALGDGAAEHAFDVGARGPCPFRD